MNELFPTTGITFRAVGYDGSVKNAWQAKELNLKVNVVCDPCNSGWMSRMERDRAKPAMTDLILGNRIGKLSPKRACALSLFAFKTAVVINRTLPKTEWFFEPSERYAFRKSFTIPNDVTMFIVGMEDVGGAGGTASLNVSYPHSTLNVCSFWVGQLGFQVVSAKAKRAGQVQCRPTQPGLIFPFYPTLDAHIGWPRQRVLGITSFDDFANRWNAVRMS